MMTRKSD